MSRTVKRPDTRLAPSDGDGNYIHIVSFKESIWTDMVRRKAPRALCGVSMRGNPDRPEPGANAPTCPQCEAIAGPCDTTFVSGHWR